MGCECTTLYSAGIMDWAAKELVSMDRRTRNILAMNGCMRTRSNIARLYLPRKEGGTGLISTEECARKESKSLHGSPKDHRVDASCFEGEGVR